jgi:osmotically-inducible protein OsmY
MASTLRYLEANNMSKARKYPGAGQIAARVVLCGVTALSLQGCFGFVAAGAVMGTLAATDRRTLGAQTEDKAIAVKAETRIPQIVGDAGHVNVTSFNRKVLLTGEVRDESMKATVEREVLGIQNVESVVNELAVAGPSSYTSRSNDTFITGKVKASFVDNKTLAANAIKVVTERGDVYLMGRVTQNEGNLAAEVARGVSGVNRVVKVFEYISDEEYRRLSTAPDSAHKESR